MFDHSVHTQYRTSRLTYRSIDPPPKTADAGPCYKVSRHVEPLNHFTAFPCGLCPVQFQCEEGGEISPASCRYFTEWLGMRDAAALEF